jgi:MFS family permease
MDKKSYNFRNIYTKNFHALTHKNFRNFWLGQFVSLMGNWMQNIGLTWLVLSITNSAFLLSLLETIRFLPITIFSLFAGVIVDKYSNKKILLITQVASMIFAFILSALVFTHTERYEYILIIALMLGFINTIYMPARQSFTVELTGKEDLMNAIALSSVTANIAKIAGPSLGAVILAIWGPGWCFFLNGLSFLVVIISLICIRDYTGIEKKSTDNNVFKEITDGFKYVVKKKELIEIILLVTILGIFVFNYDVIVPVFTRDVLHQSEKVYGLLMSFMGVGALIGAIIISAKSKFTPSMKAIIGMSLIESALLVLISFTKNYYLTAVLLAIGAIFNMWFSTATNSSIQLSTKDEYRGRVMSVYFLVYSGTAPIGYMFAGTAMDKVGASKAFFACGAISIVLIGILVLFYKLKMRHPD